MRQTFNVFQLNVFYNYQLSNCTKEQIIVYSLWIFLHACYTKILQKSSHQNLSISLISILSFSPKSAEGNENSFHRLRKVYKHGNDGSLP